MSLQHSVEQGMALGKDVVWVTVWGRERRGSVVCFCSMVPQKHCRCELAACRVQGCCTNSARSGLMDQSIWSNGNSSQDLLETQ